MRSERYEEKKTAEPKKRGRGKKAAAVIVLLLLVLAGGAGYYGYTNDHFPAGVTINGADVGRMSVQEANDAVSAKMNRLSITLDGEEKEITAGFKFDGKSAIRRVLRIASVDPRNYIGKQQNYALDLPAKGGINETASALEKAFPDPEDVKKTEDAYIDYEVVKIVRESQGEDTDYEKFAKAVAEAVNADPEGEAELAFSRSDFVKTPAVTYDDLGEELKFAKYYIADGMTLREPNGSSYPITPKQLSKIILYSTSGPKYSEQAAYDLAAEIAEGYSRDLYTVSTMEGDKTLLNYVLDDTVDVEKTGASILEAAKKGEGGQIFVHEEEARDLSTRAEVSISTQTVYYVKDNEVVLKSKCVTGGKGNDTPRGIFELQNREMNVTLTGPNADGSEYASKVTYWMPFNGGIGFHDASWRTQFGGNIYVNDGSHGCINMPKEKAEELFDLITVGTLVYVYD